MPASPYAIAVVWPWLLAGLAFGYLLGGGLALPGSQQLTDWLQALAKTCPHISCPSLPPADEQVYRMPHAEHELLPARKPRRAAGAEHWWIASYSALRVGDQTLGADSSQAQQLLDDEVVDTQVLREVPGAARFRVTAEGVVEPMRQPRARRGA